jgi:hypothetical protein
MFVKIEERDGCGYRERVQPLDEASKLMLKTADLIEKRGLPDCAIDKQGRGCVIVTMGEVGGGHEHSQEAIDRLNRSGIKDVAYWSDSAGGAGRFMEVVAKLRAVALGL